jgi:holo-[acyl-carrier protein] synthase
VAVLGVGIDVCDIARFAAALERTPTLAATLFVGHEVGLPVESLAARFAAKEALAKALGAPGGMDWHDCEVVRTASGLPVFELRGSVLAVAERLGVRTTHLSLAHDGGLATAYVLLEG